jgi:thioredoxin-related protein
MGPELKHGMMKYAHLVLLGAAWLSGIVKGAAQDSFNRSIQSLEQRMETECKLGVVFFYTEWCTVCQAMEHVALQHPEVRRLLDDRFAFAAFDAESKVPIQFGGQVFCYRPSGVRAGIHEWALELASVDGKINYPTLTVFNAQNEILFQHSGLLGEEALIAVLKEMVGESSGR